MTRMFREPRAVGQASGSTQDELSSFVQAIRGDHVSSERELLEWLAKISPRHEAQLRAVHQAEAAARKQREQLEWLAKISERHETRLRAVQQAEAEAQGLQASPAWPSSNLTEQTAWDSSKHPRLGGPPNAGYWASAGGAGGGAFGQSSSGNPFHFVPYSGSKRVEAQEVSATSRLGHHWAASGAVFDPEIRPLLSDNAVHYALGSYSGATDPNHLGGTYGGVSHPEYNAEVKKQLKQFLEDNKIKKMTKEEMEQFVDLVKSGRSASGAANPKLGPFNEAIKGVVPKGTSVPSKMDDILAAGRKYLKRSRYRNLAIGAVVSTVLGDALAAHVDALDVAANTRYYRDAIKALNDGDLDRARRLLTADDHSLYAEILHRAGASSVAALNFKRKIDKAFADAHATEYK